MKVIMLQDVSSVGYQNEVVNVSNGFANNYLIPRGFAEVANTSNQKKLAEIIKKQAHKEKKVREEASTIADQLQTLNVVLPVRADENGNVFGAVTAVQLALALQERDFSIEPRQIKNLANIKAIGTYQATVQIYKDVEAVVNFEVKPLKE